MPLWPFIFQEDVHWRFKLANHSRFDFLSFVTLYTFTLTPWIAQNLYLYLIRIFLVLSCGPATVFPNDSGRLVTVLVLFSIPEALRQYFAKYGELKECVVMRDPVSKRSRYSE